MSRKDQFVLVTSAHLRHGDGLHGHESEMILQRVKLESDHYHHHQLQCMTIDSLDTKGAGLKSSLLPGHSLGLKGRAIAS